MIAAQSELTNQNGLVILVYGHVSYGRRVERVLKASVSDITYSVSCLVQERHIQIRSEELKGRSPPSSAWNIFV